MSLFEMIGDVVGQLHDMKQLSKLQDDLTMRSRSWKVPGHARRI